MFDFFNWREPSVPDRKSAKRDPDVDSGVVKLDSSREKIATRYIKFRADLQQLMREHEGEWVAYSGETQIAIDPNPDVLARKCSECALTPNDYLILCIEETPDSLTISPQISG
jgi:hypothetical protein